MSTTDKLLEQIRKLLEQSANTKDHLKSWQELLERRQSVSPRSIMAAQSVKGMVGSWAGSYDLDSDIDPKTRTTPVPKTGNRNRLGLRGVPEINFPPYGANTNNFGHKSPALMGHPVSFEVFGPTLKNEETTQEWTVSADGLVLTMVNPTTGDPQTQTVDKLYTVQHVSHTGQGGNQCPYFLIVSDWGFGANPSGSTTDYWLEKNYEVSRYEIFRVNAISQTEITLVPGKPITDHFTASGVPTTDRLRGITIVRPKVAELVPITDYTSSKKTWAVVPPQTALRTDLWPSVDSWLALGGAVKDWGGAVSTPIPTPVNKGMVQLNDDTLNLDATIPVPYGRFRTTYDAKIAANPTDYMIRIYQIEEAEPNSVANPERLLGYFEVAEIGGAGGSQWIDFKRREEAHPTTGNIDFGDDLKSTYSGGSVGVALYYSLHKKVKTFFDGSANSHEEIEAARLTHLIDPRMVGRSANKIWGQSLASGNRADKALFDTRHNVDPGNLLDLGFRMVLYPATDGGEPDWNKPITSREVVLDPNINENQWVDIDYAAGLVTFSHEPKIDSDVWQLGADFKLFAAFVPYSMENGQTGTSVRVTGGSIESVTMGQPIASQSDVFSKRIVLKQDIAHGIVLAGSGVLNVEVQDHDSLIGFPLPQTGVLTPISLSGDIHQSLPVFPLEWYYSGCAHLGNGVYRLQNVQFAQGSIDLTGTQDVVGFALRRREDIQYKNDLTYGSATRVDTVRHAFADMTYNMDGSVTVLNTGTAGPAEELRAFYPWGTTAEVARFHLNPDTLRWTTNDPPWYATGAAQPPNQTNEIGLEISRGRLFTSWKWQADVGTVKVSRFMHKATSLHWFSGDQWTPQNEFHIQLATSAEGGNADGFSAYSLPNNHETRLNAVIEGATLSSKAGILNANPTNERIVVAVRKYESESFGKGIAEGPNNPIVWYAWEPAGSITDFATWLNSTQSISTLADVDPGAGAGEERLKISGRNVRYLPAHNRIKSQEFSFPMTTDQTLRMVMTIRSADLRYQSNWVTFEYTINPEEVSTTLADADELAQYLNSPHQNQTIGDVLDNAGFYRDVLSSNPIQYGDRQFRFIGPADNRHDGTANQIILICTGHGCADNASIQTFYNVEIELRPATRYNGGADLIAWLDGEFTSRLTDRGNVIGLFWGANAYSAASITPPTPADLLTDSAKAAGTIWLGFSEVGSESLSGWLGSYPITAKEESVVAGVTVNTLNARQPTGDSWYYAEQASSSGPEWPDEIGQTSHQPQSSLNLSRWANPKYNIDVIDLTDPTAAGYSEIYVSYSNHSFPESKFTNGLQFNTDDDCSLMPSWVVYMESYPNDMTWGESKEINWDDVSVGDLVHIDTNASVHSAEGRIIDLENDNGKILVWALVSPNQYSNSKSPSMQLGTGATLHNISGAFAINSVHDMEITGNSAVKISIIPSTLGSHGTIKSEIYAAHGVTSSELLSELGFVSNQTHSQTAMGDGYIPGSSLIGSGRVSLFSPLGVSEPTGISFHTLSKSPVKSGGDFIPSTDFSTFLESGVFTTTYIHSDFGQDSSGIWKSTRTYGEGQRGSFQKEAPHFGGVGGVRISGDAHIWLRHLRPLQSHTGLAYVSQVLESQPMFGAYPIWNPWSLTGGVEGANRLGGVTSSHIDPGAGHAPSGVSALGQDYTKSLQEATIQIELTRADLKAFQVFDLSGRFPFLSNPQINIDSNDPEITGQRLFGFSQRVQNTDLPNMVSSLEGCYIQMEKYDQNVTSTNEGVWRICGAPVVVANASKTWLDDNTIFSHSFSAGQHGLGSGHPARIPASSVVATIHLRVERWATVPTVAVKNHPGQGFFAPQYRQMGEVSGAPTGLIWKIYRDSQALVPVFIADVVDPGGSPTGAPKSLRGLTLHPKVATGKDSLLCDIVPILTDDTQWGRLASLDHVYNDSAQLNANKKSLNKRHANGLLLGIHDQMDNKGRSFSRAFVAIRDETNEFEISGIDYARMVVYSTEDESLQSVTPGDFGEFEVDAEGRLNWLGQPRRLGPGILMDGGLGLVQATAFRATPQPKDREQIGALSVLGRGGYPFHDYLNPQKGKGIELPSTFNTTEFHGETTIVSPTGRLNFEDAWAGEGLIANWNINIFLQEHSLGAMERTKLRTGFSGLKTSQQQRAFSPDTLFPQMTGGIHFKTPGTMVYEKPIRPVDATGINPYALSWSGSPRKVGIVGLEIPMYGEALLLPKGPPTLYGVGKSKAGGQSVGHTPLDNPLYEFTNAVTSNFKITSFNICPNNALFNGQMGDPPNVAAGVAPHIGYMGSVHQGYRHSRSREDSVFYGVSAQHQIRIMDGMVIEDITAGQFYTAGDIGRWIEYPDNNPVYRPGESSRPNVCGTVTVYGGTNDAQPEIVYDLGPHYNPSLLPTDPQNGPGDRVTMNGPGRPLSGHEFRITPNVEFVPVLGRRSTQGGLIPAQVLDKGVYHPYPGADAFFYSTDYHFKASGPMYGTGDVGRMIYICGTYEYKYTGWWVIVDVVKTHLVHAEPELIRNVAVVRKWKRNFHEGNIPGEPMTNDGAFPMEIRTPILQSVGAYSKNSHNINAEGHTNFDSAPPTDFYVIVKDVNLNIASRFVSVADFVAANLTDMVSLVLFLNADVRTNGQQHAVDLGYAGNPNTVTPWIQWSQPPGTGCLRVQYDLNALPHPDVLGPGATLQVTGFLRTDGTFAQGNFLGSPVGVGFYAYVGGNQVIDRCEGDRNNHHPILAADVELGGTAVTKTTANGLRWVFSHPLGEENVGSYLHLTRPRIYRFGEPLISQINGGVQHGTYNPMLDALSDNTWTSGHQRVGDNLANNNDPDLGTEIFRVNRCPNTNHIIVGGDCEVYYPEFISLEGTNAPGDLGKGIPIMYSPLSTYGHWPVASELPTTVGSLNHPLIYALQPIARERIVTISPSRATSSINMMRGKTDPVNPGTAKGPQGLGPGVITGEAGEAAFMQTPWVLLDRNWSMRNNTASTMAWTNGNIELNNSNSPDPAALAIDPIPPSVYSWCPAGEWWQMFVPGSSQHTESYHLDASHPPPTLRIDLTDAFTQSMSPGSGLNSPHQSRAPKGVRLNRLWVNFGVWGNDIGPTHPAIPGYALPPVGPPQLNDVLKQLHMCFNLIVEIPGSQQRSIDVNSDHPKTSGTAGFPFGGRVPTASRSYDEVMQKSVGGTIVVPLYVNREAGDMMPNVMERWVDVGPVPAMVSSQASGAIPNPLSDWAMGDYEFGFGCSTAPDGTNDHPSLYLGFMGDQSPMIGNAFNPILWGGIDFAGGADGGPFTNPVNSLSLHTPFARASRVSGGVRSRFTSGLVANGADFKKQNPHSLNPATMTGIVVAHSATHPGPVTLFGGTLSSNQTGPTTCPHAFTIALTPVGDDYTPATENGQGFGVLQDVTTASVANGDSRTLTRHGRTLKTVTNPREKSRLLKVGNWLDIILEKYGFPYESGSMLPPGARVYLEVSSSQGCTINSVDNPTGAGAWVGSVKCSFEVETADGTAWSKNINRFGDEEG